MSKVLIIDHSQTCRHCPIVVEFMDTWNCPITRESNYGGQMCNAPLDSDETFVKEHPLYKELDEKLDKLNTQGDWG